jgi:hypothetical protein
MRKREEKVGLIMMRLKGYLMFNKSMFLFLLLFSFNSYTQTVDHNYFEKNREVYFQFQKSTQTDLNSLSSIISIANVVGNSVFAFANEKEYGKFLKYGIAHTVLPGPGIVNEVKMANKPEDISAWDSYPTYDAYVSMMTAFETAHPDLCKIIDAGTTVQGRHILFAKITQNINVRGAKPQFMYTSSMHGNETTGYVLLLRLIDTLLSSYGNDTRLTNLVDSVEIWINPLANPDGTYHGGNSTVNGATRYNANSVDLNRNFPDPQAGQHPDGSDWQPETVIMMNLIKANNFTLSANFHCGAQVFNYPWDTWAKLHPDNTWYQLIGRNFADTVHAHSVPGYMTDLGNGITNGYKWYQVEGGRQDYMNYYGHGREVTIELSYAYILSPSLLPTYWNYLYRSFLYYMENTYYGIRGTVKDSKGNPIKALVTVSSHDADNSQIYSDSLTGSFYRMIAPGTYSVTFSADSFAVKTISNINVANYEASTYTVVLDSLHPVSVSDVKVVLNKYSLYQNYPNPFNPSTAIEFEIPYEGNVTIKLYDILGNEVRVLLSEIKKPGHYNLLLNASNLASGMYIYKMQTGNYLSTKKMMLTK